VSVLNTPWYTSILGYGACEIFAARLGKPQVTRTSIEPSCSIVRVSMTSAQRGTQSSWPNVRVDLNRVKPKSRRGPTPNNDSKISADDCPNQQRCGERHRSGLLVLRRTFGWPGTLLSRRYRMRLPPPSRLAVHSLTASATVLASYQPCAESRNHTALLDAHCGSAVSHPKR